MKNKHPFLTLIVFSSVIIFFVSGCQNPTQTPSNLTIQFDVNGGSGTMPSISVVESGTVALPICAFTRTSFSFVGWSTSAGGEVEYVDGTLFTIGSKDITLFAQWAQNTQQVLFDANGGSGTMVAFSVAEGATVPLPTCTFTNSGYSFVGWSTTAGGSVEYAEGAQITMGDAEITLFAQWAQNIHQVLFNSNSGEGTMTALSIAEGTSISLPFCKLTKSGYRFIGWSTTAGGSVEYADEALITMGSSDITLFAQWEQTSFNVQFNSNGGSGSMTALFLNEGATINLPSCTITRSGYKFIGWSTTPGGSVEYADEALITIGSSNITLFALWFDLTQKGFILEFNTSGELGIIGYEGPSGNLTIPDYFGIYPLIYIGNDAFYQRSDLTNNLILPNSVTTIGDFAFYMCGFTGSLILSDSVTTIGDFAFYMCGFTGSLILPDSITTIGKVAFRQCTGFRGSLVLPDSITSIGIGAFDGCVGFSGSLHLPNSITIIEGHTFYYCRFTGSLILPDSVTTIGNGAFSYCCFTGSLTLPDSIDVIGDDAFAQCSGFTGSLVLPDLVTTIGSRAFESCSGLNGSLTLPVSVTTISSKAFYACPFTGSLTLPNSITSIGDEAFHACGGFTGSLTLPDLIKSIGHGAFAGCAGFTGSLILPDSITSIGNSAFSGCTGFTGTLTLPELITTIDDGTFVGCSGFTGSLILPDSITSIGKSAFSGCTGFTGTLTLPELITTIDEFAFSNCSGLTGSLTLPESITTIAYAVFMGCSGFNGSLTLPNAVSSINSWAFRSTNFTGSCMIPASVSAIGDYAFLGFQAISFFEFMGNVPPVLGNNALTTNTDCPIVVPAASLSAYQTKPSWAPYVGRLATP